MRRKLYLSFMLIAAIGIVGVVSCRRADEEDQVKSDTGKQAPSEKAAPEKPGEPRKPPPAETRTWTRSWRNTSPL